MSAPDAAPLPRLGEVFFDVRGDSRSMRLSWYADTGVAVFSIWQGGTCTGTFRLPIDDLPRMIETLQRGPQRRSVRDGGRSRRADRQRAGSEPGYYGDGDYGDGDGDYDQAGHGAGGYDQAGHGAGAYDQGGYDAGHEAGAYDEGGYDAAGYEPGAQTQVGSGPDGYAPDGYAPDGYGPDGYAPDEPASGSRRRGGGHRAAVSADNPDVPVHGYGDATGESPRAGTSRSEVPAGSYWRQPDDYQPGEYQTDGYRSDSYRPDGYQGDGYQGDGYETDGYRSDSYRADGYQTAAYQSHPADHGADAESDLAGYGQERFVPPYVRARVEAYPNDNPVASRPGRQGGSGPAYPADHGGVSAEAHRYARQPRSRPGYLEGPEIRLAADTPVRAPYSAGGLR